MAAVTMILALLATMLPGAMSSASPESVGSRAEVADDLQAQVDAASDDESVTAVIVLDTQADLTSVAGDRDAVVAALQQTAQASQADLTATLNANAGLADLQVLNQFWITNAILVEFSGGATTLNAMAEVPGIDRIVPNAQFSAIQPEELSADVEPAQEAEFTWGMERIGVDRIYDEFDVRGEGVVVATLDTGVDIDHPDLAGKMATDDPDDPTYPGGWMEFDAYGNLVLSEPHDSSDHGTHVAGTIHGGDASGQVIGAAPASEMMHGLVIPGGGGTWTQVAAGMEWAIAPTDAFGHPAGRPADIVNMSLGGTGFVQEMVDPIVNMRLAGVLPVVAIGNRCSTNATDSPGNVYDALGVGNTTVDETVSNTSCGGVVEKVQFLRPPAHWPAEYTKPDLSAPGTLIRSAQPGGGWHNMSGTSMASPHIAGAAALMLSANPDLSADEVQEILTETSVWNDQYAPAPPDTRYGHGRIDAYEAFVQAAVPSGVSGTVNDRVTGEPVADATITVSGATREAIAEADGSFALHLDPGTHTLEVSFFGYDDLTIPGVVVDEGAFTTIDPELNPIPTGTIVGSVTLAGSDEGVPAAQLELLDVPTDLSAVSDSAGTFDVSDVPVGTYELAVERDGFTAPDPVEVTVTADTITMVEIAVELPPVRAAVMGQNNAQIRDILEDAGYEVDTYHWGQIEQVRGYSTVVVIGLSAPVNQGHWDDFEAATDLDGTGIIFTDSAMPQNNGITRLSDFTGHPAEVDGSDTTDPVAESYYEVTQTHPILEGYEIGDQVPLQVTDGPKPIAWFSEYADDGREVLAEVGRTDETGIYGNGIAVQERPNNRYALLSSHSVYGMSTDDWTPEATEIFTNAADWVTPALLPQGPVFTAYDLDVSPDVITSEQEITITAQVKNVGGEAGSYDAVLRIDGELEDTQAITLGAGDIGEVSWTTSRAELGSYDVTVATEAGEFRVRAPYIDVEVHELHTPQHSDPGPLAGATVELIAGDELISMGHTDQLGQLQMETTALVGEYTLVIRHPEAADGRGYLLTEDVTVIQDDAVVIRPRVLEAGQAVPLTTDTFVTVLDRDLDRVNDGHQSWTYLRPSTAAPHGFGFATSEVVASLGTYGYVHIHQVQQAERDWWLVGDIVNDVSWRDPYPEHLPHGGDVELTVEDVTYDAGDVSVGWNITDGHGNDVRAAQYSDLRPFSTLPEVIRPEQVLSEVRLLAPNTADLVLRLQHDGEDLRVGAVNWAARPFTFTQDALSEGEYTVLLEADTGTYSGVVSDSGTFTVGDDDSGSNGSRPGGVEPALAAQR